MDSLTLREHQQKTIVMLRGFWLLRGWGSFIESAKKGKIVTKIYSQIMLNVESRKLQKMISADRKATVKQEIK